MLSNIDETIAADERKLSSEGFVLANKHQVESAPFFIVNEINNPARIYTAYYRFMQDIFQILISEEDAMSEIMAQNTDLDYI